MAVRTLVVRVKIAVDILKTIRVLAGAVRHVEADAKGGPEGEDARHNNTQHYYTLYIGIL